MFIVQDGDVGKSIIVRVVLFHRLSTCPGCVIHHDDACIYFDTLAAFKQNFDKMPYGYFFGPAVTLPESYVYRLHQEVLRQASCASRLPLGQTPTNRLFVFFREVSGGPLVGHLDVAHSVLHTC